MKKLMMIICILSVSIMQAQDSKPKYEVEGNVVKATYFYSNGKIHKQGYFKNTKPTGKWVQFDKAGNKIIIGNYKAGKKVGKWFMWSGKKLREINYTKNVIASVKVWKEDNVQVAVK